MPKKFSSRDIKNLEKGHPYSRKAKQLKRCALREDKLSKQKQDRNILRSSLVERMSWFKDLINDDQNVDLSIEKMHELVAEFISRYDAEKENLIKSTKGRPKPQKVHIYESIKQTEIKEYEAGFLLPNLLLKDNVELLKEWNGDSSSLQTIQKFKLKKLKV